MESHNNQVEMETHNNQGEGNQVGDNKRVQDEQVNDLMITDLTFYDLFFAAIADQRIMGLPDDFILFGHAAKEGASGLKLLEHVRATGTATSSFDNSIENMSLLKSHCLEDLTTLQKPIPDDPNNEIRIKKLKVMIFIYKILLTISPDEDAALKSKYRRRGRGKVSESKSPPKSDASPASPASSVLAGKINNPKNKSTEIVCKFLNKRHLKPEKKEEDSSKSLDKSTSEAKEELYSYCQVGDSYLKDEKYALKFGKDWVTKIEPVLKDKIGVNRRDIDTSIIYTYVKTYFNPDTQKTCNPNAPSAPLQEQQLDQSVKQTLSNIIGELDQKNDIDTVETLSALRDAVDKRKERAKIKSAVPPKNESKKVEVPGYIAIAYDEPLGLRLRPRGNSLAVYTQVREKKIEQYYQVTFDKFVFKSLAFSKLCQQVLGVSFPADYKRDILKEPFSKDEDEKMSDILAKILTYEVDDGKLTPIVGENLDIRRAHLRNSPQVEIINTPYQFYVRAKQYTKGNYSRMLSYQSTIDTFMLLSCAKGTQHLDIATELVPSDEGIKKYLAARYPKEHAKLLAAVNQVL